MGYYDNYFKHSGIKGMKWGVRRFQNADGTLTTAGKMRYGEKSDLYNAKKDTDKALKTAGSEYNKSLKKAYRSSSRMTNHLTKKGRQRQAEEWEDFAKKAKSYDEAKQAKKDAKKAYKEEYKKNLKDVRENASLDDKLTYDDATFRRAANIMTKYKGVSMAEANKQAKKEYRRNTALIIGAYAGVAIGGMLIRNHEQKQRPTAKDAAYLQNLNSMVSNYGRSK